MPSEKRVLQYAKENLWVLARLGQTIGEPCMAKRDIKPHRRTQLPGNIQGLARGKSIEQFHIAASAGGFQALQ